MAWIPSGLIIQYKLGGGGPYELCANCGCWQTQHSIEHHDPDCREDSEEVRITEQSVMNGEGGWKHYNILSTPNTSSLPSNGFRVTSLF